MDKQLFEEFKLREVVFANRIGLSPMCQYSAMEGQASDWHLAHYGARAVGRLGLALMEAAAVLPEGRISAGDLGLWDDRQIAGLVRCVDFMRSQGVVAGIQLAHAGRKASTMAPWLGGASAKPGEGGWSPLWGPSALPFDENSQTPLALTEEQIATVPAAFAAAATRARLAGFQVVEVHAAHGYLLHQFLSPLTNRRSDHYGGSFENRIRLTCEVVAAVRTAWPAKLPLFVRISATDWVEGGWDLEQSIRLARELKALGVDLIDTSSGGLTPDASIPVAPGFQVPFAEAIRREAGIATAAVGLIREPDQADRIVREGQADLVLLGRQLLREPYWPLRAARELGASLPPPPQYARAIQ